MSFGVGVSDILFFVNQTLEIYGQCRSAPAELQVAGRNVEQMRAALQILGEAVADKESLLANQPAIALIIKHESKPLREDLSAMNTILQDYIDKSDNMGVIGRVRYAVLDRNKLQSITASLMRSRTNFGSMLDLINLKAHEQHARSDLASQAMLKAILDRQIQEGEARKAEARARGEKNDGKLEEILQILKERHPAPSKVSSEKLSQSQFLSQIETELQKLGLTKTKAKAVRHDVAKALSESEPPVPMPTLLYPKEEPREKRRISDPFPQTNPEMHRSHSAQNGVSHVTNLGSTPKKTGVCRILCVDSTHGIRAILAHTYLELLRIWTANRTGRWLFKRVHSAGNTIRTNTDTVVDPIVIQGIKELLPEGCYDWAIGYPHETGRLRRRMEFYNPHGFSGADLSTYDFIICFTQTVADRILKHQAASQRSARIVVLPGCNEISSDDCAKDSAKIKELIASITAAIKGFVSEELGDWTDGKVERTKHYRTLEMVLPGANSHFWGNDDFLNDRVKRKEYENQSGCSIQVSKYKDSMKEVLVSITGPKERLSEAAALIRPGTSHPSFGN